MLKCSIEKRRGIGYTTHPFIPSLAREGKPEGRGELSAKRNFKEFGPKKQDRNSFPDLPS